MVKKTVFLGAGLVLLLGLLFGRSHVLTSLGIFQQAVRESVPVEYDLKRARQMIADLDPEIRRNMHLIAKEEVEVAKLNDQLQHSEEQLAKAEQDILRLKADLERGDSTYVYVGRSYTAKQVKNDLEHRWDRFKVKEGTVEKLNKILEARQAGLSAAQEKLKAMLAAKQQLEVDVENLEARLKMVEVAQTSSSINFDDSHLSRTRELVEDINTRIDVAEKMVHADTQLPGQIQLDDPESQDVLDEITQHFGKHEGNIVQLD